MKFLHLADLHLGKRYFELSLIDDQRHILKEILKICRAERPDGMIIAGDIYDKSVPSAEAVELFDQFLRELKSEGVKVFAVSGNHDSAERIAFGSSLMSEGGVYFSPVYCGEVKPVVLNDCYGEVAVYLLPFIKPSTVRRFFEGTEIDSYTDAVRAAIRGMEIDKKRRNVLVAHQFVTGAQSSGSEEFSVGDVGNVDCTVFEPFDYVALGHIHGAQNVSGERIRYSGTPLKYSLSEAQSEKSVTVVELGKKGSLTVRAIPLLPLRDVKEVRGTYSQITAKDYYFGTSLQRDLVHITLTDEDEVPDAIGKLRIIYPNVMSVRYDNRRTQQAESWVEPQSVPSRSPMELFSALYKVQNNGDLSEGQRELLTKLIEEIWEGEQ